MLSTNTKLLISFVLALWSSQAFMPSSSFCARAILQPFCNKKVNGLIKSSSPRIAYRSFSNHPQMTHFSSVSDPQELTESFEKVTVSESAEEFTGEDDKAIIVNNAQYVTKRMNNATTRSGRGYSSVQLVCVSKTKPPEDIQTLYDAGFRVFGENYFQELLGKAELLPKDIKWHFIGNLQTAKASKLVRSVPNLSVVETVDTLKLAKKLDAACEAAERPPLSIYIQVDTSGEETKSGVDPADVVSLVLQIRAECPNLMVAGLMTIGAPDDYTCFDKLVLTRAEVAAAIGVEPVSLALSMGMSGDYEEAVERGATNVRVGSTIFGARAYANSNPNKK